MKQAGYDAVTGVDISEVLVQRGLQEFPQLDLRSFEGGKLPFEDNEFDAALLLGVLTSIPETAEQARALKEIIRVLKPGGILYLNDFLFNNDKRNLDRYKAGVEKFGVYGVFEVYDGGVMRHHDAEHMRALLGDFEILLFEETVYDTMHGNVSNGFYSMARLKVDRTT